MIYSENFYIKFKPERDTVSVRGRDSDLEENFQIQRGNNKSINYFEFRNAQM